MFLRFLFLGMVGLVIRMMSDCLAYHADRDIGLTLKLLDDVCFENTIFPVSEWPASLEYFLTQFEVGVGQLFNFLPDLV